MWKPKCCITGTKVKEDGYTFDKAIILQTSTIDRGDGITGNGDVVYTNVFSAYSNIVTRSTRLFDNGVNISSTPTTVFTIQWVSFFDDTLSYWVLYNNKRFKINNIENINEADKYLKFVAVEKGKIIIPANNL